MMTCSNEIRNAADLTRFDRSLCDVYGAYRVIPRPARGDMVTPEDYAVIVLDDGTELFLETFGLPQAQRDEKERSKFNGASVHIVGTAYLRMPTIGQGPLAPCVCDILTIEKIDEE